MKKLLFLPHNGYHTYNMSLVLPYLREDVDPVFVHLNYYQDEGALRTIQELNLKYIEYSDTILRDERPDAIIVMNDWEKKVNQLIRKAKSYNIPTIGIIEGVQDFFDTHYFHLRIERIRHPYMWVEFPFLMGKYDQKFIINDKAVVTGHMRFDPLWDTVPQFPEKPLAIINSNFTYNRYASYQMQWINEAVDACKELGIDYAISVHHADDTDFSGYNVYKGTLVEALQEGTFLISRFSTTLIEAMIIGKPVIYHNSHGEIVDTYQEPMGAFDIARSKDDLKKAISGIVDYEGDFREKFKKFLNFHVYNSNKRSSAEITADEIHRIMDMEKVRLSLPQAEAMLYEKLLDIDPQAFTLEEEAEREEEIKRLKDELRRLNNSHSMNFLRFRPRIRRFLDGILGGMIRVINLIRR